MSRVSVPTTLWKTNRQRSLKVILRGVGASFLPQDIFINSLYKEGVLKNSSIDSVNIIITENNRKRYVYGDVSFEHRQEFSIPYKENKISFLLIDPSDNRKQVTLLHMPIETTPEAIAHIFKTFHSDIKISNVTQASGSQIRHDRWQLLAECYDFNMIHVPDVFILPNMSPEGHDIYAKIFVEGRPSHPAKAPHLG